MITPDRTGKGAGCCCNRMARSYLNKWQLVLLAGVQHLLPLVWGLLSHEDDLQPGLLLPLILVRGLLQKPCSSAFISMQVAGMHGDCTAVVAGP